MTQNDLARKMDISNAAISQWLGNDTPPGIPMLVKLEKATGIEVHVWMGLLTGKKMLDTSANGARVRKRRAN